jgi:hypothetical protein
MRLAPGKQASCRQRQDRDGQIPEEGVATIMTISQVSEGIPGGPETLLGKAKDWQFLV